MDSSFVIGSFVLYPIIVTRFRAISVSYAFKKDTKGERHGTAAERMLAAQNPLFQAKDRPNQVCRFIDVTIT